MENISFDQDSNDAQYRSIFSLAYRKALSTASSLEPAPGLINNDYVDMEGHPGTAVIILTGNNKDLQQWVLANVPGARKLPKGRVSISCPCQLGQSFERQTIFCMQFTLILADCGVRARVSCGTLQANDSSPEIPEAKRKVGRLRIIL